MKAVVGYEDAICTPDQFLKWTGKPMDPRLLGLHMVGARILVVRDEAPDTWSSDPSDEAGPKIFIPDNVKDRDPPGVGVVIAAGPLVGIVEHPYPGGLDLATPDQALGLRVYFKQWTGVAFRMDSRDTEFRGKASYEILIMCDRDIQIWARIE